MKKLTLLTLLSMCTAFGFAQNTCDSALVITAGVHTIAAVNGSEVPAPICAANGGGATAGEWYKYTPAQDYTLTVSTDLTQNAGRDTRFHIYMGTCSNLSCFGGDDDGGSGYLSYAQVNVVAGTTYYIAFDNRWESDGFDFQLTEGAVVLPAIQFIPQSLTASSNICNVSDMNGDYLDDIVTVGSNDMTILHQLVTGGFSSTTYQLPGLSATPSWSIATGDYDGNGFNDLVFGGGSRLAVIRANNGGTAYTETPYPQYIFTQRTNFIDINHDGQLDLFACHDVDQSHAYRNDGAGNLVFDIPFFATLDVGGNYQSMWTDYDNNGFQDMYMSKCRGGAPVGDPQRINLLYHNNGDGTFTERGAAAGVNDGAQSWSTAIEDFDNDGDMDFLLSNISDQNKLYRNNGDGTFTDIYATSGIDPQVGSWELQAADFNNDGWVDFLWQNGKELYLNNGDLTFTGYDLPFGEGGIGDLNNDGFLDVQTGGTAYMNTPNDNNWVKITLVGVQSNRNGIGARVEIYGAWGKQIREIRSGSGFSHQSTLNAHFGIGEETAISQIRVVWPSGVVDVINNPAINAPTMVVEGSSPVVSVVNTEETLFSIFPNPTSDIIVLKDIDMSTVKGISIYNIEGKLVKMFPVSGNQVNVQSLAAGTYFITIQTAQGEQAAQKFVKQ